MCANTSASSVINILHISDLHISDEVDATSKRKQDDDNFFSYIKTISSSKNIDYVIVTGDIAWKASVSEYNLAKNWLDQLRQNINHVNFDKFVLCPGNHDLERAKATEIKKPTNQAEANYSLTLDGLQNGTITNRFENYKNFIKNNLRLKDLQISGISNNLIGILEFDNCIFVVLNSAWYSMFDNKSLYVGKNFVEAINNDIEALQDLTKKKVVLLQHHGLESFDESEYKNYRGSNYAYNKLLKNVTMVCTGHDHASPESYIRLDTEFNSVGSMCEEIDCISSHSFVIYMLTESKMSKDDYIYNDEKKYTKLDTKDIGPVVKEEIVERNERLPGLDYKICDTLKKLGYTMLNIYEKDLQNKGQIIWPVVPREEITIVHKAQIELMKILAEKYGCKVNIIISDLGSKIENGMRFSGVRYFKNNIVEYISERGIEIEKLSYLSNYFNNYQDNALVFNNFKKLCLETNFFEIQRINMKNYSVKDIADIEKLKVIDYISPIFQQAVLIKESELTYKKSILIAGADRLEQWENICSFGSEKRHNYSTGGIFIPKLETKNGDIKQDSKLHLIPKTKSDYQKAIVEMYNESDNNYLWWLFVNFILLKNNFCNGEEEREKCFSAIKKCLNDDTDIDEFIALNNSINGIAQISELFNVDEIINETIRTIESNVLA